MDMKDAAITENLERGGAARLPGAVFPKGVAEYFKNLFSSIASLLQGMGLTLSYFVKPSRIVTQQYPENREELRMFERFRGRLIMEFGDDGHLKCSGCTMCEKACPNGAISVLPGRDANGKRVLGRYLYRLSQCTLCNLCVESCRFGAIRMGQDYELAAYNRDSLNLTLYDRGEAA
jgi:NADH-quinone oxidoreductase subunit I